MNPHYGTPGNPADRARVPGGSSSGARRRRRRRHVRDRHRHRHRRLDPHSRHRCAASSATSRAAWRIPTAGAFPLSQTHGFDRADRAPRSRPAPRPTRSWPARSAWPLEPAPLAGLRIGIAQGMPLDKLDETVSKGFAAALDALKRAGARLYRSAAAAAGRPWRASTAAAACSRPEAFSVHRDRLDRRGDLRRSQCPGAAGAGARHQRRRLHRDAERAQRAGAARWMRELADLDVLVDADDADRRPDHRGDGGAGCVRAQERACCCATPRSGISSTAARSRCRCRSDGVCRAG